MDALALRGFASDLVRDALGRSGRTIRDIEILVDDTIATLYVDGVALSVRMYDRPGPQLCVTVVDGSLTVHHAAVAVLST